MPGYQFLDAPELRARFPAPVLTPNTMGPSKYRDIPSRNDGSKSKRPSDSPPGENRTINWPLKTFFSPRRSQCGEPGHGSLGPFGNYRSGCIPARARGINQPWKFNDNAMNNTN